MGSRAVVVVCRDASSRRFGVAGEGVIFARTGRAFFNDRALEASMLHNVRAAITSLDMWTELESDWLVLDSELLPWSAKAEELLRTQYASVGAAATATHSPHASSASASKHSNASSETNRSIVSMNASLACLHWNQSASTRVCNRYAATGARDSATYR